MNGKRALGLLLVILLLIPGQVGAHAEKDRLTAVSLSASDLATAIAQAEPGDTLNIQGGTFYGNLTIDKPLTLNGHDWPVVDGQNEGTVITINAPGVTLRGFLIRHSGASLDQENSGVAVEASQTLLEGNRFEETLFGIYARHGHQSVFRDNLLSGKQLAVQRRGDPIRIWYSNDVLLENNTIRAGRDVVLWYSERLTIRGNTVSDGRYGLHFMYCDDALIEQNRLFNNSVGAFLMYSRRVTLHQNTIAHNRGPSGYGIGLKDMDDTVITGNHFLDNRIGAHLDTTPREVDSIGLFQDNLFAYNEMGLEMMPSVRHNQFINNSFLENGEQVVIAGGGQPGANEWGVDGRGNYWSDYAGYDADGDGYGDIPYRSERLFEDLLQKEPNLRLFAHSPAVNALDFAARAFPLVKPKPKLVDERPLTTPFIPTNAPPLPQTTQPGWPWLALGSLSLVFLLIIGLPRWGWGRYHFPATKTMSITTDSEGVL